MIKKKEKFSDSKNLVSQKTPVIEPKVIAKEHKKFRAEILEIKTFLEHFSGPLPPPDAFAKYDKALTGAANRILIMAEKQLEHRQKVEKKIINSNIVNERIGLIFGLVVALSALAAAMYCAHLGQTWPAVAIGGGSIAGLVAAFVQGTRIRRRENKAKKK